MTQTLLIGMEGFRSHDDSHRLVCCSWGRLDSIKNISDFDTVIVSLLTLPTLGNLDVNAYERLFTLRNAGEILKHQGRMLIVGDPRQIIRPPDERQRRSSRSTHTSTPTSALDWAGLGVSWDDRAGKSINYNFENYPDRNSYARYLSHLQGYDYAIDRWNPDKSRIAHAFDLLHMMDSQEKYQFRMQLESFVETRYAATVAAAIRFRVIEVDRFTVTSSGEPLIIGEHAFGSIILLPPVSLSDVEAVQIILEDACEIELQTEEPRWVSELIAPGQEPIDADIACIEKEINGLLRERQEKVDARVEIRLPLRLLYAQHHDLEDEVRSAFEALGAQVEHDENSSGDDGWLAVALQDSEYHFVLEVKGTTKSSVNEYGLKQLDGWVSDGVSSRGIRAKPLLVVNASAALPVEERQCPFGSNFMRNAAVRGTAVIRSQDLFECLSMHRRGELNVRRFWQRLFDHAGVASSDDLCNDYS